MTRIFGPVPGIEPGALFNTRAEMSKAGLHRPNQAGISGTAAEGADSVVVSGGYKDDKDYGNEIIYTGQGGQNSSGNQIADQELVSGNRALAKSYQDGLPVRVTRGATARSEFAPSAGYRYDGVFYVTDVWTERSAAGFVIWRFRLENNARATLPGTELPVTTARREVTATQLVRSVNIAKWVKEVHEYKCQFCGIRLEGPAGYYAEAAHIRPLGEPHNGPDSTNNLLCLCPNHHKLFDMGAIYVSETLEVVNRLTGSAIGKLFTLEHHVIDTENISYNRMLFPIATPERMPPSSRRET